MNNNIKSIWIEAENTIGERCFENENTDVIVEFENGEKYISTFFTYNNIVDIKRKNSISGECLSGKYFWASNMFIINDCKRDTIEEVIKHIIEYKEFYNIFIKV